ncbi:hypothetical protein MKW98_013244, partial [Papaver atlanticum]
TTMVNYIIGVSDSLVWYSESKLYQILQKFSTKEAKKWRLCSITHHVKNPSSAGSLLFLNLCSPMTSKHLVNSEFLNDEADVFSSSQCNAPQKGHGLYHICFIFRSGTTFSLGPSHPFLSIQL